jgi:hypothetical protein
MRRNTELQDLRALGGYSVCTAQFINTAVSLGRVTLQPRGTALRGE